MNEIRIARPNVARKPLCLVTGGASGFGFELAHAFAEANCDLVLAGDGTVELDLAAEELAGMVPEVEIHWVSADLSRATGPATLHHKLRTLDRPIDIFVANTSVGAWGEFGRTASLDDELATAQINAMSTLHLSRLIAKDMEKNGSGQIMLASSHTASSCPFDTLQSATRAFTSALAEGLGLELQGGGVIVTSLCPDVESEGPCVRIQDPAALVELARAARAHAVSKAAGGAKQTLLRDDLKARYERYLVLSAESPMA